MENEIMQKRRKQNKLVLKYLGIPVIVLISLIMYFSDDETKVVDSNGVNTEITFKQIGYLKDESKLRYFTFFVEAPFVINADSVPQSVFDAIEKHGIGRTNTAGNGTASFYYLNEKQTPDITMLTPKTANEVAHNANPVASVWIYANGKSALLKWPGSL